MKLSRAKKISILAVFGALTVVFYPIPFAFLLPVLLASIWFDTLVGFVLSALFGLVSYLFSFVGASPLSLAFRAYPLIAIIPRLFIGPTVVSVYRLLKRASSRATNRFVTQVMPAAVAGGAGSAINSILVIGCFAIFGGSFNFSGEGMAVLVGTMIINAVIEFCAILVVVPVIDGVCRKFLKKLPMGRSIPSRKRDAKADSRVRTEGSADMVMSGASEKRTAHYADADAKGAKAQAADALISGASEKRTAHDTDADDKGVKAQAADIAMSTARVAEAQADNTKDSDACIKRTKIQDESADRGQRQADSGASAQAVQYTQEEGSCSLKEIESERAKTKESGDNT